MTTQIAFSDYSRTSLLAGLPFWVLCLLPVWALTVDALPAQAMNATIIVLTGDTSDPELSTFVLGEPIELRFSAEGLEADEALMLDLRILDEHDNVLSSEQLAVTGNEQGKWQGKLEMSSDRLGFRRVEVELSNGVTLQALGSRKAGYLTYAIVPDPDQRKDYGPERSRFGLKGGFGRAWANRAPQLLGARWVLDGTFEWRRQEPDRPGQFAEKLAEDPQQPASPQPWQTYALPTLMAAPQWAVFPETFSYMTGTLKPEHEDSWQAYCRLAVEAFMQKYPDQSPRIYQITWEPQPPWGFKGKLSDLVRIYELAYPIIHEVDPDALVAGPTLGLQHRQELQDTAELFAMGLADYLDVYTAHPYFSMNPERDGMIQRIRTLKEVLAATGKPLPMHGTEQGQTTKERRDLELQHAQVLIRQNLITLGEGFEINHAFTCVDYRMANQSGYGYYYNLVDGVPFGPARAGPKPIAPAYAAQTLLLDGAEPVRTINWLGETAWGYAFEREGEIILALWDWGNEPREVRLPVGVDRVRLIDWMGNGEDVAVDQAQTLPLTLGPEVVYIVGVSPALWGKAGEVMLTLEHEEMTLPPGGEAQFEVAVQAPDNKAIEGTLVIHPDGRLGTEQQNLPFSLAPGERRLLPASIAIPPETEVGDYPVQISLDRDGTTLALAGQWLHVIPPVEIERVRPSVRDDQTPALRITLRDNQRSGQNGELSLHVQELMNDPVTVSLEPGGDRIRTLDMPLSGPEPHPLRRYSVRLVAGVPPYRPYESTHEVNWLVPAHLDSPPRIDGDLADWSAIEALVPPSLLDGRRQTVDPAVQVMLGWDARALYVAIEVVDDLFVQNWAKHTAWRGDSIQLSFNLDPDRDHVMSGNELADAGLRPRTSRVVVALTREGTQVYRHATHNADELPTGLVPQEQIRAAIQQDGQKLTYELAIPWTAMGGDTVTPGQLVGLNIEVNDLDVEDWHKTVRMSVFQAERDESSGQSGLIQLGNPQ